MFSENLSLFIHEYLETPTKPGVLFSEEEEEECMDEDLKSLSGLIASAKISLFAVKYLMLHVLFMLSLKVCLRPIICVGLFRRIRRRFLPLVI